MLIKWLVSFWISKGNFIFWKRFWAKRMLVGEDHPVVESVTVSDDYTTDPVIIIAVVNNPQIHASQFVFS